jgi:GntR family transcriptional regulator
MLQRNVPLADQAILAVLSGIETGELVREGGLLPSESELAQRFGVSRATIREALAKLEFAGVVIRRHGIGTYVNQFASDHRASIQYWIDEAVGFMDLLRASNQPAERKALDAHITAAGTLASRLGISSDAPVLSFEGLFFAGSVPVIHCVTTIPMHLIDQSKHATVTSDYQHSESPYQFLEQHCGRRVHHQRSEVRAVLADARLADLLQWEVGQPLLWMEEVGYDSDLTPLFHGVNHFHGDQVSFLQVRRPALSIGGQAGSSIRAEEP